MRRYFGFDQVLRAPGLRVAWRDLDQALRESAYGEISRVQSVGTYFAQVELHRKIDVWAQLH